MDEDALASTGVIGDRHSAALVRAGDVDWWCPGRFDAPSVCAGILDARRGGRFRLAPAGGTATRSVYDVDTNVLVTDWMTSTGTLVVHDLMPLTAEGEPAYGPGSLLRIARCTQGRVDAALAFAPRPAYGAEEPEATPRGDRAVTFQSPSSGLFLAATRPVEAGVHDVTATWSLPAGEVVAVLAGDGEPPLLEEEDALQSVDTTRRWWGEWIGKCQYEGPYKEAVLRSALVLEMLSHAPTGAIVAAVTTSLPEWPGGSRNWDYRYVWMRDAAFAVDAFKDVGHRENALRLAGWIHRVLAGSPDALHVLYTVDGLPGPEEQVLEHLAGHGGSRPVRIGNAAAQQFQLDMYGELVECLHMSRLLAGDAHEEQDWDQVRRIIQEAADRWREADQGIWEMRTKPQHHVLSKALAWVALDRGVQAIHDLDVPGPAEAWTEEAAQIRASVLEHGFDEGLGAFVQAYGSTELDAANLLLPILGFIDSEDPRMQGTVDATMERLAEDGLLHRYRSDDGLGAQVPFTACSFWLVEALAQMGRLEEAQALMDRLLELASPFGLYAQNVDPQGRHHGNFPQGLSHIALISAAMALERARRQMDTASPHLAQIQRGWAAGAQ